MSSYPVCIQEQVRYQLWTFERWGICRVRKAQEQRGTEMPEFKNSLQGCQRVHPQMQAMPDERIDTALDQTKCDALERTTLVGGGPFIHRDPIPNWSHRLPANDPVHAVLIPASSVLLLQSQISSSPLQSSSSCSGLCRHGSTRSHELVGAATDRAVSRSHLEAVFRDAQSKTRSPCPDFLRKRSRVGQHCFDFPTTKVLLEVVHPIPGAGYYTFGLAYLVENMPWFLQLPLREEMDVCIDTHSFGDLVPLPRRIPAPPQGVHWRGECFPPAYRMMNPSTSAIEVVSNSDSISSTPPCHGRTIG